MVEKGKNIPLVVVPRKKISTEFLIKIEKIISTIENPPSLILLYDHKPNFKNLKIPINASYGMIDEITNIIVKEYDWFQKLEGYGFYRLIQFLCAPEKVIFRDDDTVELGPELINFQMKYLGKKVKEILKKFEKKELFIANNEENYEIGHIIGTYRGKNMLQFSNGPSPIELLKLDGIWYNPNKGDEVYRNYAKNGKMDPINGNRINLGTFFYSNHGCSSQTSNYYSIIPPMDGWIRGNDDTNASRILFYLKEKMNLTSASINYGVQHNFHKNITQNQTNRNLAIHINTVFFEPLARWIFDKIKSLNKYSLSPNLIIKKVGELIVNQEYYELKELYQKNVLVSRKKLVMIIDKLKINHPEIYLALQKIKWLKCEQKTWEYFQNTGNLFLHWNDLFKKYKDIVPTLLKEIGEKNQ